MLEKLKTILTSIREERKAKLERFTFNSTTRFENKKAILTLELPHLTDTFTIHYAKAAVCQAQIDSLPEGSIGKLLHSKQLSQGSVSLILKRIPQRSIDLEKIDTFLEKWIKADESSDPLFTRRVFVMAVIKEIIESFSEKHLQERLKLEELHYILTLEAMCSIINEQDIEHHIKERYLSEARSFIDFFRKEFSISPVLMGRRARLSLNDAAVFFDFLENRALRSATVQKFNDLLLCRTLFYAPLPEKKIFELTPPSECRLTSGDNVFYVPETFVRLWKGFSRPNLFDRAFDDRQLHKKIQRLGKYAELKIDSLTPSILRLSGESAYENYLSLSDDVVALLPKRNEIVEHKL